MQDLEPLQQLARKRCQDDKGTVRKAALELLAALMAAQMTLQPGRRPEAWRLCCRTLAACATDPLVCSSILSCTMCGMSKSWAGSPADAAACQAWRLCCRTIIACVTDDLVR